MTSTQSDSADDPEQWLPLPGEGSREGYRDMELFIASVEDPGRAERLAIAIHGRGAFRRFKDELARWPGELERWHALLGRIGLRVQTDIGEVLRGHASLSDAAGRSAFLHTLRTIVDAGGQRVDASDRLYLAAAIPFLIVWGERDPIIPVAHAHAAHRLVPGSRLEIFPNAGHFPHLDNPLRFVRLLDDFMASCEPAQVHAGRWSQLLRDGADRVGASTSADGPPAAGAATQAGNS